MKLPVESTMPIEDDSDQGKGHEDARKANEKLVMKSSHKKRSKKPKDMPRRPLSAYNMFFREEWDKVQQERNSCIRGEGAEVDESRTRQSDAKDDMKAITQIIASRWRSLSPEALAHYKKRAEGEKQRYQQQMNDYYDRVAERVRSENSQAARAKAGGDKLKGDDMQSTVSLDSFNENPGFSSQLARLDALYMTGNTSATTEGEQSHSDRSITLGQDAVTQPLRSPQKEDAASEVKKVSYDESVQEEQHNLLSQRLHSLLLQEGEAKRQALQLGPWQQHLVSPQFLARALPTVRLGSHVDPTWLTELLASNSLSPQEETILALLSREGNYGNWPLPVGGRAPSAFLLSQEEHQRDHRSSDEILRRASMESNRGGTQGVTYPMIMAGTAHGVPDLSDQINALLRSNNEETALPSLIGQSAHRSPGVPSGQANDQRFQPLFSSKDTFIQGLLSTARDAAPDSTTTPYASLSPSPPASFQDAHSLDTLSLQKQLLLQKFLMDELMLQLRRDRWLRRPPT